MNDQPATTAPKQGLLGVCAAIGEDFGFNPEYLRAALVLAMLWNAYYVLAGYCALGAVVALSRWLVPSGRKTSHQRPMLVSARADIPAEETAEFARAA